MKNISLCQNCCGCSACFNICPKKAITMEENEEGFLYPKIDKNKCNNCGLCYKICPSINSDKLQENNTNYEEPKCYAGAGSDELKINLSTDDVPMIYPYLKKGNKSNYIFWKQIDKYLSKYELYLKNNLISYSLI